MTAKRKATRKPDPKGSIGKKKPKVKAIYAPDDPGASPVSGYLPPKETQFKPGNPGGPGRRPDPAKGITRALRRLLADGMEIDGKHVNITEALARRAVTMALSGKDIRWWQAVIERNEGKVPDKTELTGKDGEPIKVEDGRDRLAEAIQRHAAAAAAPVGDDPSDGGEADPSSED